MGVYRETQAFPLEERFGLSSQMRRAAISVASNIVEGCARRSEPDFLRFLDIAYGSARELEYQISVALRLAMLSTNSELPALSAETSKVLHGLIASIRP